MNGEYRVEIKVRNNLFLKKLNAAGYKTIGDFCRINDCKKYLWILYPVVAMTESPFTKTGDFHAAIEFVAEKLMCSPYDLFTEHQLTVQLETNQRTIEVNEAEARFFLSNEMNKKELIEQVFEDEKNSKIHEALKTLTPREAKILDMRLGLSGDEPKTLEECGRCFGITRTRVRDIEAKALYKLRRPSSNLIELIKS